MQPAIEMVGWTSGTASSGQQLTCTQTAKVPQSHGLGLNKHCYKHLRDKERTVATLR